MKEVGCNKDVEEKEQGRKTKDKNAYCSLHLDVLHPWNAKVLSPILEWLNGKDAHMLQRSVIPSFV